MVNVKSELTGDSKLSVYIQTKSVLKQYTKHQWGQKVET